ncbi:MAG: phosphate ABC transporter substrate-binding/OmpA family protein [Pseudomonas sp.]|uniref:phosphate ABC transporter substrate-binding/OmpA family protein n=1 Tax=Pseudomonas sp. TaxID=306 RepID=UPI0027209838|nr:phosphate ABC transporter substrate-binding/OmpA family protein [Pseudomonas sp.]MDO9619120.1 phosphate ABC transporter substrate-binding/OmpA family protein [Pseudomonas sp.]MDP2446614.1 phosphate ABC transporter substrate-binding/OmpA family protein [Pseudomonas sp.]MDZ4337574.1 phosphate ABC transporter substrate-binding/OmpA family protein [Pseudomonas sp.]
MSRASAASDRDTWIRTASFLLLGSICYALPWSVFAALPVPSDNSSVLRIQGSNTIGARLGPALVKGLFEEQGLSAIRIEAGNAENEQKITGKTADGSSVSIEVAAHGSGTGFTSLADGSAELAASSRPIKDSEATSLLSLGDLKSASAEQIIALDGLAIILHPSNPIAALNTAQLAQIFAGEISDWAQLGAPAGAITLYARDDKSGTFDTFKELVLSANGKALSPGAKRFESSEKLSDFVSQDPNGIGFIGLPYIRQAKAVAIAAGDSQPMLPSLTLIATEDYPLSRRLFFYNQPDLSNPWGRALVQFAHSVRGQAIVDQNGFIAQTVQAVKIPANAQMPANYQALAQNAQRLSVNFRFQEGSANLDNKALRDLNRLMAYLREQNKLHDKVVLVGFGDAKADPARAELLSKLRAMAVRRELNKSGVIFRDIIGLGDELPVAANSGDEGRIKNRRVEVWVY